MAARRGWMAIAGAPAIVAVACSAFEADEGSPVADAGADATTGDVTEPFADAAVDEPAPRAQKLYLFGGLTADGGAATSEAYAAEIHDDGTLGDWTRAAALDITLFSFAWAATPDGTLVLAGGQANRTAGVYLGGAHLASLDPISAWTDGPPQPVASASSAAVVVGGTVFVTGGNVPPSSARTEGIWSTSRAGASLVPWADAGALPSPRTQHAATAVGRRVYVTGGYVSDDAGAGVVTRDTAVGIVDESGSLGGWQATGELPEARSGHRLVQSDRYLFVVGGRDVGSVPSKSVFAAEIRPEDPNVTWLATASMPGPASFACAVAANGVIYVLGGDVENAVGQDQVYIGRVEAGGAVTWSISSSPLPQARRHPACTAR